MSRIGKQPITIPEGVEVKITNDLITVKGPKGQLTQTGNSLVKVEQKDNELLVTVNDPENKQQKSLWGLYQRLIANMVAGVTQGFSKKLEINGVGYKVALQGKHLNFQLGYSHPIDFPIPEGIEATVEKNVITISGSNKQLVGQTAADIRSLKKPEPYKGKGIKYSDEIIRRKAGKAAAKGAA
ncbi:MAG: 50S ribosomal protein L6 [Candidatus Buchananbacteria bacterium]|nr:50S ribosomal protein L6 [Candidatus Buchananbacteria bacterium]